MVTYNSSGCEQWVLWPLNYVVSNAPKLCDSPCSVFAWQGLAREGVPNNVYPAAMSFAAVERSGKPRIC
eukprot:3526304-Amphidinium_carterae.1